MDFLQVYSETTQQKSVSLISYIRDYIKEAKFIEIIKVLKPTMVTVFHQSTLKQTVKEKINNSFKSKKYIFEGMDVEEFKKFSKYILSRGIIAYTAQFIGKLTINKDVSRLVGRLNKEKEIPDYAALVEKNKRKMIDKRGLFKEVLAEYIVTNPYLLLYFLIQIYYIYKLYLAQVQPQANDISKEEIRINTSIIKAFYKEAGLKAAIQK